MSSNYDSLLAICKDESASDRFVRKLSSGVAPNASSIDAKYPVLFHCWVEEQVRLYAKHSINADLGPTIVPVQGVVLSAPSEEKKVSVPTTLPPPIIESKNNELEGLTFGGIKIGVKAKQQKKRMTPNLVSDKPNIHAVQGNINSLAARNEVADIRKELKDIGSSLSTETKGMTKDSDTIPNRSILGAVDGSAPASQSTAKPEPALPAAISCGVTCPNCAKLEDLSSVVRLASIYSKLVLHQYLPLAKVLPVIQQLTSLDPDLCSKTSLPVCSNANPVLLPLAKDSLIINSNCIRTFLRSLLGQLHPLLTSCGHLIANEIADAVSVRTWAPELSVKIKELLNNNASEHAAMVGLSSGSANFRLPETFQKPFREDLDSKNEFKTQLELATFYERERTYDELSNLFLRYQTTNRSDLDGSAIKMFFRTDLLKTGTTILTLKEPNYLWFAELFMRFLLYHGVQSTPAVSMITTKTDTQPSTEGAASTKAASSSSNTVSLGSHVTSTLAASSVSNVATTASAFSASPSRNTAFERALSAAASPIRKKQSCAPIILSSTTSIVQASASQSNLNTKFYSSNFPDLSATKKLTLDAAKQSKLEERLGMGGEAKTTLFSPSHTTVPPAAQGNAISTPHSVASVTKKWGPAGVACRTTPDTAARITPSSSVNSANNAPNNNNNNNNNSNTNNNSGPFKRNGPPSRTSNSYSSSAHSNTNSPSVNHSAIDPYEVPAMHFAGTESFFFRFIVSMNNFRFNQGLLMCILVEIEELMRNDNNLDASFVNLNMESDSPTKSRKLSIFLPSDQNATKHHDGQNEVFIAPEDFALKVAKLKILGRFLGLLHFYHQWVPLGVSENGPVQKLASELAAKRNALQVSLPVLKMVQEAHREGKLSLALPWVVEFLKMLSWDPAVSVVRARARGANVAHNSKGAMETDRQRIPYFDVLERLRSIQHSEKFKVSAGESNHSTSSGILSCNRVYCLMEIQNLWIALPHAVTSLIERCEITPSIEPSPSMRPHLRSRDSPWNFSEASPVEFLSSVSHDTVGTLDDQNLAFSAAFLRHVVPFLEPVYLALKSSRLNGTASSSLRARALGAAKKIKRQTPSVITAESMALMEALAKPPPPPTVDTVQSASTVVPSLPRTEAIAVITATPTKAARSSSATSSTSASKSPRKKSSLDTSSGNISSMSIANMKSPVRRERSRNPSFESLSPPAHSFGLATGLSGGPHLGGTSRSNSITTSGRSSPAGGLFGSSRRQRSLSDLNHNPFSISRQHSMSPAPLKSFGTNTLSPLKLFEYNTSASESSDVLERLEISFWNDHPTLQTMNNFLLAHSYQACLEKLKELIGTAVRELIANLSSIKSERDNHKYEDLLETYSKRAHYELLAEGEQLVETFFTNFTEKTLPDMCKMYPANERVVKMAIFYMNRHLSARKAPLCAYLKSYSAKKLAELRELSIKQHHKQQGDATNSATPAADFAAVDNGKAAEDAAAIQRTECLAKMRVVTAALVPYLTFSQDAASSSADQVNVLEQCTCELSAQALLQAHSSGLALPVCAVMRNNIACVLALLQELTAQCSVYASTLLALRPTTDGSSSLHLTVRNDAPVSKAESFKTMLTKLTSLYQSCIVEIASVITRESSSMSSTAQAELAGKVGADFCKFVISVLPHALYLDLTLSVLSKPAAESAITALTQYATVRNTSTPNESALTSLPSDLVHFLLSEKMMSLDMLSRAMALTARPKTAAYFENCKGLVGMQLCMNHALLSLIGRILIRHQDTLGIDMSALEDDCWYKDSTVKLLVKSNLNEGLSNLISVLLVNL